MAKLFGEMRTATGVERHQIANKQLCATLFYGSKEHSIRAVTVCATVEPHIPGKEKTVVITEFVSPRGDILHFHKEEYPMPKKRVLLEEMVTL